MQLLSKSNWLVLIIIAIVLAGNISVYAQKPAIATITEEEAMREKIIKILEQLRLLTDNKKVLEDIDWLTFYISLIPVPVLQQAGQVANKIVGDHSLNIRFEEVNKEIGNANSRINDLENDFERIEAMAKTVYDSPELEKKVREFIEQVIQKTEEENTEFIVNTSNWSIQVLLRQIIEADIVSIKAEDYSRNIVQDSKIKAKKTELRAKDHSMNIFDRTHFQGDNGSVGMQGIGQTGKIDIEDSVVTFKGPGSSLIFGPRPRQTMKGNCPFCGYLIEVDKQQVSEGMLLECPNCKKSLPIHIQD